MCSWHRISEKVVKEYGIDLTMHKEQNQKEIYNNIAEIAMDAMENNIQEEENN